MVPLMDAVSIHRQDPVLSLVTRSEAGEEIVVRRGATPVAKIVAYHAPTTPRRPGALKGQIVIAEDFDESRPSLPSTRHEPAAGRHARAALVAYGRPRAVAAARDAIADAVNEPFVSAASVWEIAIKRSLGKLTAPDDLPDKIADDGFPWLPISAHHAWQVRELPLHHRDPFDRILVAQALIERLPIITD